MLSNKKCTACTNLHSDTTLLQPNRTSTPVHTETEQYTYIQSPDPEDECNNIRNILSNKKCTACTNLRSDTTPLQPNRTNTPVHTETEQYTYIQSPAPEDECNNIRNMLSNKKCTACTNLHSDTTLLQPNRTNTPVHTETEQYTYIQSPAPEDECNNIRNILSNTKLS
jgi:hypothetical protein